MQSIKRKITLVLMVLAFVLIGKIARAAETSLALPVQEHQIDLFDEERQRPVRLTIWSPAGALCQSAQICLAAAVNQRQVAVFSHGAMGAAKGYSWLGKKLAAQGVVTIGVNHFGESWIYGADQVDPVAALRFWLRPKDISFSLDELTRNQDPAGRRIFSQALNFDNVTAIGHSSGGATVLALAGAALDLTLAAPYCQTEMAATDRSCAYLQHLTALGEHEYDASQSYRDPRIQQLIVLDPALGHVTRADSLQQLQLPVLVVGSFDNDFLPYARHAGFYAAQIPQAKAVVLKQGEGHFVYLDACRHAHQAMGVPICTDRSGVDRQAVHQHIFPAVAAFFAG